MSLKIGQLIEQKLNDSNLSRKEFAERISKSRTNLYSIFAKTHISTAELTLISKALEYNFFTHYYEELKQFPPSNQEMVPTTELKMSQEKVASLQEQVNRLEIENAYLKKINKLLEESKES